MQDKRRLSFERQTDILPRPGVFSLPSSREKPLILSIPESDDPVPLLVFFHGAEADSLQSLELLRPILARNQIAILAPSSRGDTWDLLEGDYGPDVVELNEALDRVARQCRVDPLRIALGGFSDGASYALSLGLENGDLISHVLAFSPGYISVDSPRGLPKLYVSHGTKDSVLPADECSRKIVPLLRRIGCEVLYHEFEGGHVLPASALGEGVGFLLVGAGAAKSELAR